MTFRVAACRRLPGRGLSLQEMGTIECLLPAVEWRGTMERLAQCHCGSLRATTSGDPILVNMCHCKACQRRTGALAGNAAAFAEEQVTVEGARKVFAREGQCG